MPIIRLFVSNAELAIYYCGKMLLRGHGHGNKHVINTNIAHTVGIPDFFLYYALGTKREALLLGHCVLNE